MDARIREQARLAVSRAPRQRRWMLPVSLAASVLAAVLLSWQMTEEAPVPALSEADFGATPAEVPPPAAAAAPAAPATVAPPPAIVLPAAEPALADSVEEARQEVAAPAARSQANAPSPAREQAKDMSDRAAGRAAPAARMMRAAEDTAQRDPREWLAEIARLRAAGQHDEADAELSRFDAAYPDWWEQTGEARP